MKSARFWKAGRRGVTVAEALTAAGAFTFMLGGLVTLFSGTNRGWAGDTSKMTADNGASLALQIIAKDVHAGQTAVTNASGSQLTLTFPALDSNQDYDRYNTGAVMVYYVSNNKLYRQQGTTTPLLLAPYVDSAFFSVVGSQVSIQLTRTQKTGNKTGTTTFSTQVYLRNEPPH